MYATNDKCDVHCSTPVTSYCGNVLSWFHQPHIMLLDFDVHQHEVLGVWEPWLLSVRTLDRVVGGPRVMMQREANIAGKILISALTGGFKSRILTQDIRQLGKRKSSQGNFK